MINALKDGHGNLSSFRIVWGISVLSIVFVWGVTNFQDPNSMAWPLDSLTTIGLFASPGVKTATEYTKKSKGENPHL